MKYNRLGKSDLKVSEFALGTMTFGEQNTLAEACAQLDYAVAQGVNFIDTAEMYPVPGKAETQGRTEEYVGHWLKTQPRDQIIVATKVAGPSRGFGWIRGGPVALDRANIMVAIDTSLKRLQTDYVDLFQLHWPDRNVPMFGKIDYDPKLEKNTVSIEEQLTVLTELVRSGKVRHIGISNETAWGVAEFLKVAERLGLQRIVSIQNPYNLINRAFEIGLHEMCHREQVSLLAYSPLAFGLLSGKYSKDPQALGRMTLFPAFGQRYHKPNVAAAVAEYALLAQTHGLSPAAVALAFVRSRSFVTSTIVGATTLQQLQENLQCIELDAGVLKQIEAIHMRYFNPAP
ncbi:MAG: NADP(H)-dependent aldo-keto reductase [Gallionellaceae bacterium]|jgi:aryl-alcohol dehydrogenase-like predicted oxidoreductase